MLETVLSRNLVLKPLLHVREQSCFEFYHLDLERSHDRQSMEKVFSYLAPPAMGELFPEALTRYSIFSSSSSLNTLEPRIILLNNVQMHSTCSVLQVKKSFYLTLLYPKTSINSREIE